MRFLPRRLPLVGMALTAVAVAVATLSGPTVAEAGPVATTAGRRPPPSGAIEQAVADPPPAAPRVLFGAVTAGGPGDLSGLDAFEAAAERRVGLYGYYRSFAFDSDFDAGAASAVRARGAVPMITWEPWDPRAGVDQPAYSLASFAAGAHDPYLSRWAAQVASWGEPLWLRFAHEMNANWYPWAEGVNGNRPGQYVAAWRHVHEIFAGAGATNVTWVWSPNVEFPGSSPLGPLYPGDDHVDWLGVDGYNWGSTQPWSRWQSPDQVFGPTLARLRGLSSNPVVIAETAGTETGGDKAAWVKELFSSLAKRPEVRAFVWFNVEKETDWRIESSPAARAAFAAGVADPRYN